MSSKLLGVDGSGPGVTSKLVKKSSWGLWKFEVGQLSLLLLASFLRSAALVFPLLIILLLIRVLPLLVTAVLMELLQRDPSEGRSPPLVGAEAKL